LIDLIDAENSVLAANRFTESNPIAREEKNLYLGYEAGLFQIGRIKGLKIRSEAVKRD
jgi:hypothetical protein